MATLGHIKAEMIHGDTKWPRVLANYKGIIKKRISPLFSIVLVDTQHVNSYL
jgi:hypothetical protein